MSATEMADFGDCGFVDGGFGDRSVEMILWTMTALCDDNFGLGMSPHIKVDVMFMLKRQ